MWEARLKKELDHYGDRYKFLQERYNREVENRKGLEETLRAIDRKSKHRPRSQNRGRGRGPNYGGVLHTNSNGNPIPPPSVRPTQNPPLDTTVGNFQRRQSQLPLPIRPSTPIRPTMNRDTGSSQSTLVSSVHSVRSDHSTFSQRSDTTNGSMSSVESLTIRSKSPISPSAGRSFVAPFLDMKPPLTPRVINRSVSDTGTKMENHVTKPSWANLVARSAASKT